MNEEPFGPVGVITRFSTFDEVIAQANRLPYGLAAYAFTATRAARLRGDRARERHGRHQHDRMIAGADSPVRRRQGKRPSAARTGPKGVDACMVIKAIHQGSMT